MKILIFTEGFFPGKKYGGPPVSIYNFCNLMKKYDCYIVCKNHDLGETVEYKNLKTNLWYERDNYKILYLNDGQFKKGTFDLIIKNIKPDYLYLQGVFQKCILPCLMLVKNNSIKTVLAPRGELCNGAFKKKYKKLPYLYCLRFFGLIKNLKFQATSVDEAKAIEKYLSVNFSDIFLLSNIPNLTYLDKDIYTKEKKINEAKVVFLGRIVRKKNLLYGLERLSNIKGNVQFDIYGPIEDIVYWNECLNYTKKMSSNIKVKYKGIVVHDEVQMILSSYDVMLFPTHSENFGHVIAESLISGCPVIISDQTPWLELEKWNSGWDINLNNTNKFEQVIQTIVDMDNEELIQKRVYCKKYVRRKFDIASLTSQYNTLFNE